jgi:hypothetical protein
MFRRKRGLLVPWLRTRADEKAQGEEQRDRAMRRDEHFQCHWRFRYIRSVSRCAEARPSQCQRGLRQESLAQLDRQLPLRLRHFAPEFLQVRLHRLIVGILPQGHGEPAIRRWKVVRSAQSRRIEGAHFDHGFGIRLCRRWFQQAHSALAILTRASGINIFLRFRHGIPRCG